jgi:hypothetical protein
MKPRESLLRAVVYLLGLEVHAVCEDSATGVRSYLIGSDIKTSFACCAHVYLGDLPMMTREPDRPVVH